MPVLDSSSILSLSSAVATLICAVSCRDDKLSEDGLWRNLLVYEVTALNGF